MKSDVDDFIAFSGVNVLYVFIPSNREIVWN